MNSRDRILEELNRSPYLQKKLKEENEEIFRKIAIENIKRELERKNISNKILREIS